MPVSEKYCNGRVKDRIITKIDAVGTYKDSILIKVIQLNSDYFN